MNVREPESESPVVKSPLLTKTTIGDDNDGECDTGAGSASLTHLLLPLVVVVVVRLEVIDSSSSCSGSFGSSGGGNNGATGCATRDRIMIIVIPAIMIVTLLPCQISVRATSVI